MSGYKKLKIGDRTVSLHRYVWEQVHGPIPEGMVVHHVNHDKLDNRIENLQLMTHADHAAHHNDRHPRIKTCEVCGESYEPTPTKRKRSKTCSLDCRSEILRRGQLANSGTRKVDQRQRESILRRLADGERGVDIAAELGVSKATVSRIKKRQFIVIEGEA